MTLILVGVVFNSFAAALILFFFAVADIRQTQGLLFWMVAALFAVHPLNADSVAWIAERKNILSTFFWMGSLLLYVRYVDRPNHARYAMVFISFLLGLMVKPMLVTLPFVFLLLDFWPLNRMRFFAQRGRALDPETEKKGAQQAYISRLIVEKIPLLALSCGSVCMSILSTQHINKMVGTETVPLTLRIGNALVSYWGYVGKMIWPFNLAVYYPFPNTVELWSSVGAGVLLIAVTVLFIRWLFKLPWRV